MSDASEAARNAAWREYQERLAIQTEPELSQCRLAFISGWRACALANETPAPSPNILDTQIPTEFRDKQT